MALPRFASLLAALCFVGPVLATRPLGAQENAETAEVRAASAAYVAALSRGNESEIAACWTDDGVYIDAEDESHRARELAHQEFAQPAAAESSAAAPPPMHTIIHFVGPTVAIEQSSGETAAASAPGSPSQVNFVAAWVKRNDGWQLSLLREFAAPRSLSTPDASPLVQLDWMIGHWTASRDDTVVELTAEWAADKRYIIQQFVAKRAGEAVRQGSQRIAWDAAAKQIRSWTFNADGGFSEAQWRKEGDVWIAASGGVLSDGRRVKSIHFWTPEGADACWFKSLHGEIDGQPADDLALKFSRSL